jgi:chromate transporter
MSGLKPAVIGLIGSAVLSIGKTAFFPNGIENVDIYAVIMAVVIFLIAAFLEFKKKMHPILVITISAVLGIIFGYGGLYL